MKKYIVVLVVAIFATGLAQAQVSDGKFTINKKEQPAIVGQFDYSTELVTEVLLADLKDKGFGKGKDKKGIFSYSGILFTDISKDKIDLYFSVVQENKKEPGKCTLYLLISKGYDNFISKSGDGDMVNAATKYLNGLSSKFAARQLDLDIEQKTEFIKETEKIIKDAVSEGKKLEEKIAENKKLQADQNAALEEAKKTLEELKKKKK